MLSNVRILESNIDKLFEIDKIAQTKWTGNDVPVAYSTERYCKYRHISQSTTACVTICIMHFYSSL